MKIVFATHNKNKLNEVKLLLPDFEILSLTDIGCSEDIPETANTLEGNAMIKANYVTKKYGYNCFADDTGLLVDALNGDPGVYSARYAGKHGNADGNMNLLLSNLDKKRNRNAHFKTIICLNINNQQHLFDGICNGTILEKKQGKKGFGYDPIFKPKGYTVSFAEMDVKTKGKISHRGLAIQKLIEFLQKQ
ncbi:MAG: non-canonical purine NTP diphosphatase [Wenyingzhuangia sp.]|jgi:XTP/dITP diphosphohydrolase|uniref:non-canonical purine NTP diphosphatase n=1 Tax=Wenyingzhuangia sp. TaxID=1964193 RepID=UPI00321999FD